VANAIGQSTARCLPVAPNSQFCHHLLPLVLLRLYFQRREARKPWPLAEPVRIARLLKVTLKLSLTSNSQPATDLICAPKNLCRPQVRSLISPEKLDIADRGLAR